MNGYTSKLVVVFAFLSLLGAGFAYQLIWPAETKAGPVITFQLGRGPDCHGWMGICWIKEQGPASEKDHTVRAEVAIVGDKMTINFLSRFPKGEGPFVVDRDIVLSDAIARSLGVKRATILAGEYTLDSTKGRFGALTVNAKVGKETDGD